MTTVTKALLTLFVLVCSYGVNAEPLFFMANKAEKTLMVVGSIHMGSEDMYPLPEELDAFLLQSDGLITEVKLTQEVEVPKSKSPTTLEVLNQAQRHQLQLISSELGLPADMFMNLPAWQTALSLQLSQFVKMDLRQDLGVDQYFTKQALKQKKPIFGLESTEDQLAIFASNPKISSLLLTDTVDNWQENLQASRCLTKSWKAGDRMELIKLADESAADEEIGELFIYQRNRTWAEKLDSDAFIDSGRYLVVVGALHLVGKENLLDLLKKRGFTVTQLSKEERANCQ